MFNIYVDGTTNLTGTMRAPAFASKGHFLDISPLVSDSIPYIVDAAGSPVLPNAVSDDTTLTVDKLTGRTVASSSSWQLNYVIFNDNLISLNQPSSYGEFFPLVCMQKSFSLTNDQLTELYGNLLKSLHAKWVMFWIWLILGLVVTVIGTYFTLTYRNRAAHKEL